MKTFLQRFFTALIASAFILVFIFGAMGCKTSETTVARLAVSYATAKYIEKAGPSGTLERVRQIRATLDELEKVATGEAVTIDALKVYLSQRLQNLSPADRALATTLVDIAVSELSARVGTGVLKPDQLVKVREVISWVRDGTNTFALPEVE